MKKIFNEDLNELVIFDSNTNEVLAIISNKTGDHTIIQAKNINILLNYGTNDLKFRIDKDTNKIYLNEGADKI